MSKTILILPDAHAHPDYDNARFDLFSELINDLRPDAVVCLGDFADMAALSHYDRGKLSGEGRRYEKDIAVTGDALERINHKWKRARYNPRKYMVLGNHEDRISRAINDDARMEGKLSLKDLAFEEHGWNVAGDFLTPLSYAGWCFAHYMPNGRGYAMGGANLPRWHTSIVVGHNHKLMGPYSEDKPDGKFVTAISAGCYVHPKALERWNAGTFNSYWIGVTVIRGASGGQFSGVDFISLAELQERYGS